MQIQQSFRAIAQALDQVGAEKSQDFLARLALILANELNDANRLAGAVQRALAAADSAGQAQ
jgi:hypothetical protein